MIAALDVCYAHGAGFGACVLFADWQSTEAEISSVRVDGVAPYTPGAFYRRELPVLVAALQCVRPRISTVIVDGYVWLRAGEPGLGGRLHEVLDGSVPVIGVAKSPLRDDDWSTPLRRGKSGRALRITAAGMSETEAAACIAAMPGSGLIPTMLARADRAGRDAASGKCPDTLSGR